MLWGTMIFTMLYILSSLEKKEATIKISERSNSWLKHLLKDLFIRGNILHSAAGVMDPLLKIYPLGAWSYLVRITTK